MSNTTQQYTVRANKGRAPHVDIYRKDGVYIDTIFPPIGKM